jgi:hypothetical protein
MAGIAAFAGGAANAEQLVSQRADVPWFYQTRTHGLYGVGIDAVGALECWAYQYPGFAGMKLGPVADGRMSFTARGDATEHEPYNFHHPDGGASVARQLACLRQAGPGGGVVSRHVSRVGAPRAADRDRRIPA